MALEPFQYEMNGYVFGLYQAVDVERVEWGEAEVRSVIAPMPREDGRRFGRGLRGGRTISFEAFGNRRDSSVLDSVDEFVAAWDAAHIRAESGELCVLRWNHAGRVRRVWGRPGALSVDPHQYQTGKAVITADFETVDHLYYADVPQIMSIGIVPQPVGGLSEPLVDPLIGVQTGQVQGRVLVDGYRPTWLVTRIEGPVLNPEIGVTGEWSARLNVDLAHDEHIVIDPSPWSRRIRRNGKENAAGALDSSGQRLSRMLIPPGHQEVTLAGTDPSGNAGALFSWHTAHHSI